MVLGVVAQVGDAHKDPVNELEEGDKQGDYATAADAGDEGKEHVGGEGSNAVWTRVSHQSEGGTDLERTDQRSDKELPRNHSSNHHTVKEKRRFLRPPST